LISTDTYDSVTFFCSSFRILSAFIRGQNKPTSDYQLETVIKEYLLHVQLMWTN